MIQTLWILLLIRHGTTHVSPILTTKHCEYASPSVSAVLSQNRPFDPSAADAHLPVDIYVGGVEHAILHLLYARFISKFLATTSLWPSGGGPTNKGEPFRKLITQGMVHGKTYSDPTTGRFLKPAEVDLSDRSRPTIRKSGEIATVSWEKMSKSKHNGVDPADCIRKYGADATRAHMLFQAPIGEVLEWHEEKIVGIQRWFGRVWKVVGSVTDMARSSKHETHTHTDKQILPRLPTPSDFSDAEADLWAETQDTIRSVAHALDDTHALNTLVSDLIKLTNTLSSVASHADISLSVKYHTTSALLRMLAPVAPAFAEECWEALHLHSSLPSPIPDPPVGGQIPGRAQQEPAKDTDTDTANDGDNDGDNDSIFHHPFPTPDLASASVLSARARARATQTCAVQENGKLRFAVEIGRVPDGLVVTDGSGGGSADGDREGGGDGDGDREKERERRRRREELERWVLTELERTDVGRRWLRGKGYGGDGGEAKKRWGWKRIVVVKGGRTVNFVG